MAYVSLEKAGEKWLELLQKAANGEEVVITRDNEPFVKLSAAKYPLTPRKPGSARGLIEMSDDFDEPLKEFST